MRGQRPFEESISGKKTKRTKEEDYRMAFGPAVFTVVFNVAEGLVSTCFGYVAREHKLEPRAPS
jgi:hypothetical protein